MSHKKRVLALASKLATRSPRLVDSIPRPIVDDIFRWATSYQGSTPIDAGLHFFFIIAEYLLLELRVGLIVGLKHYF